MGQILIKTGKPKLHDPLMIVAFKGWNDGGQAASGAVKEMISSFDAKPFAHIDAESFYNFVEQRPRVYFKDEHTRALVWPENQFYHASLPGAKRDVILFSGVEPHLHWRTFCSAFTDVVREHQVSCFVTLGGFLTEVLYSSPISLTGLCNDPSWQARCGIPPTSYEGPTGIIGILQITLAEMQLPALSLWAGVPYYISVPNPKATLALLKKLKVLFSFALSLEQLEAEIVRFDQEISEMIANNPNVAAYLDELKKRTMLN